MKDNKSVQNNRWLSLWVKPRATIRRILETNPQFMVIPLALLYGFVAGITWIGFLWSRFPNRPEYHKTSVVVILLIMGALFGLVSLYIGSALYRMVGGWLKGKGKFQEVKCAVAWSFYPFIVSAIFAILSYTFYQHPFISFAFSILNLIFLIWAYVLFFHLLGEAHQFSAWRALGTVLITIALIFAVLVVISLLIPMLQPMFSLIQLGFR